MSSESLQLPDDSFPLQSRTCAVHKSHWHGSCIECKIRHLTVFGVFEPDELRKVEAMVGHRDLVAGQELFQENAEAQYAYSLVEGTVRLFKLLPDGRRQVTGFAISGDFLGLSSAGRYAYSAEAVSGARLCRFSRSDLQRLFERFPAMGNRVLSMANDELAAAQDQMLLLGRKTPIEKVSSFLLILNKRLDRIGPKGDLLELPMKRADVADFLGLTVETVSRSFSKLRDKRIIALPTPEQVRILDRVRLGAMASGYTI